MSRNLTQYANRPRLTVGLPVFNGANWLRSALDSLLSQSYENFELIISDNGSSDATQSICEEYAARDKRIRYVRQETNRGLTWNWNQVFALSRSEYFKWAACDDVYHPAFLARCIEVLDHNRDVAWCHSRSRHINDKGELLLGQDTPDISYAVRSSPTNSGPTSACRTSARPSDRFQAVLLGHGGCLDSYGVIRSDVLRKTGVYIPYFGSEKVLMAELALWGRYHEVPEPFCFVRVHKQAAGNIRTQDEQRRHINPFGKKWQSDRLGLLCGYFAAVRRSKISITERLRCYATISKYLLQVRKWKSVLAKAWNGAGLAAEYPMVLTSKLTEADSLRRLM
jgi:glycosyltransferase involved in cell wall biosynthesis